MRRTGLFAGVSIVSALVLACGGKGSPSAPTPSVQSVTVSSSSDMLFIGASETFTATATTSSGGTQPVTGGAWGSDAPGVANVDSSGRVTGVGSGNATIYVDYQGHRGTKLIRGLPNFQGTWSGSYFINSCTQTGDFARANFCSNFPANRVLPTNLNLTQDRDRVSGRFFLGTLGGDGSGPVDLAGQLAFTGAVNDAGTTIETSWSLNSSAAGRIGGGFNMLWRISGASGDMRVSAEVRDLNRSSTIAAPQAITAPSSHRSLEELIRALTHR